MISCLKAPILSKIPGLIHGFFGRSHGLEKEDPEQRKHIFTGIGEDLGFLDQNIITVKQTHSAQVLVVDRPFSKQIPEADAIITQTPGLLIGILTADCVPVLLSTKNGKIIAAVHAGWRGAFSGIIYNTLEQMRKLDSSDIVAAIGPCIWQDSYEVSASFYEELEAPLFFKPGNRPGHWQFDLPGYVISILQKNNVKFIEHSPKDTYANREFFFSYRRKTHYPEEALMSNFSGIGILS